MNFDLHLGRGQSVFLGKGGAWKDGVRFLYIVVAIWGNGIWLVVNY
jgi:hypothetical protein